MLDSGAPSAHPGPPVPARVATEQATGEPVGVEVGVARCEGVIEPVLEGSTVAGALGVVLGEAPKESDGVGVTEGADTN